MKKKTHNLWCFGPKNHKQQTNIDNLNTGSRIGWRLHVWTTDSNTKRWWGKFFCWLPWLMNSNSWPKTERIIQLSMKPAQKVKGILWSSSSVLTLLEMFLKFNTFINKTVLSGGTFYLFKIPVQVFAYCTLLYDDLSSVDFSCFNLKSACTRKIHAPLYSDLSQGNNYKGQNSNVLKVIILLL